VKRKTFLDLCRYLGLLGYALEWLLEVRVPLNLMVFEFLLCDVTFGSSSRQALDCFVFEVFNHDS